jgi:hypothetical protein
VTDIQWPDRWQKEARTALATLFGSDVRVRIIVDDPATAIDGTVLEGFVYLDQDIPTIIHDHSGRADVFPWKLLSGPVLRICQLVPRRPPRVVYAHPDWNPRHGQ